jgi:peptidoglycan/xylan/chitin deacetylase (PgdA/CDA1 family)
MSRPLASLSLDLDNLWSYMKIHGDPGWQTRPSYLDAVVPYVLDVLERERLRITFFVVGADAAETRNHAALRSIVTAGHEVGNHSFEHEPWLHLYSREQLEREVDTTDDAIEAATGVRPNGFRGPGFSWCPELLEVLSARGYVYDASTLPTWLGPIARTYYFWTARLSAEERERRKGLFGAFADGLRPNKPYRWSLRAGRELLEIPVTTIPGVRTPFHFSYLAFLARISEPLMIAYLRTALTACRLSRTEPSFLLHPLDVVGGDQAPELGFFPGMDISSAEKTRLLRRVLGELARHFELVPMGEHARQLRARASLKCVPAVAGT